YAGELEESSSLSNREQEQVSIICNQGIKIRELVNDLNLVSKLFIYYNLLLNFLLPKLFIYYNLLLNFLLPKLFIYYNLLLN
ncbi:hypothetical protein D1N57_20930, partial [Clostridioides difficile]